METSTSHGIGFRSRRSYPSLNHVSLAPLTRFPIDDDATEPPDYFSPRDERSADAPTRTSYLASFSVPGTPGVLSHSRSGSRVRSKSSNRTHRSDSSLQSQDEPQPLHHHHHHPHYTKEKKKQHPSETGRRDAEWMLRAGIALASSTREEKGQSWLVKRESSTSLVSETAYEAGAALTLPRRSRTQTRSGRSTPAAYSRRGSRSRVASRRNSRPDLTMTCLDDHHPGPDFVDERVRAEMASIQQFGDAASDFSDTDFDSEDDEDIDELELQRLTRERGFGLGSWIDRLVEWTLFGVEDLPLPARVTQSQPAKSLELSEDHDHLDDADSGLTDDNDSVSDESESAVTVVDKPGEKGGWEDVGWLFHAMKRALL